MAAGLHPLAWASGAKPVVARSWIDKQGIRVDVPTGAVPKPGRIERAFGVLPEAVAIRHVRRSDGTAPRGRDAVSTISTEDVPSDEVVGGSVRGFPAEGETTLREVPIDHVVLDERLLGVRIELDSEAGVRVDVVVGDSRVARSVCVDAVGVIVPGVTTIVDAIVANHRFPGTTPACASDVYTTLGDVAVGDVIMTECYVITVDLDRVLAAA